MKGIVLAGGSGTRLHPATLAVNKQLLPVYDKPMIYYPLSVLMLANIRDILLISAPEYIDNYKRLFGDGSDLGINMSYAIQPKPEGLAQAFTIGREFVGGDNVALILGDNIFYGPSFRVLLERASARKTGATVFSYRVDHPEAYGVVEFDKNWKAIGLEEKPLKPKSHFAVTGLYFYDNQVLDIAANLKPSARGELEITDLNRLYLEKDQLYVEDLKRGFAWLDTGTHDSLIEASEFVRVVQKRQGIQVACLEEIAFRNKFISREKLIQHGNTYAKTNYGKYLLALAEQEHDR
jgi:glucose-1-phosphate thymidylyltransferase